MRKFIYISISFLIIIIISFLICEFVLNIVPVLYRNLTINQDVQYVYVLGESTADGFPYRKISYSKIFEYLIKNQKIDNKKIEMIYLQESGCQLYHQYINYVLYRYRHPYNRGIMLLYMGTNNWANANLYTNFGRKLRLKSILYQLVDKYLRFVRFETYEFGNYDFEYEYEKIVSLAKKFGDDIYISTISGNYEFPPDFYDLPVGAEKIDELYFNSKFEEAKILLEKFLESQDLKTKAQLWYRMGKVLEKENDVKGANDAFIRAHQYGFEDKPEPVFQNKIIKKIAKKYNIPVFDFFNTLYNSGKVIGFDFFIDTIHPNIKTHIDIAYGFIDLLKNKYQFDYIDKKDLDIENLKTRLGFNNNDLAKVIISRIIEGENMRSMGFKFNLIVYEQWGEILKNLKLKETLFPNSEYIKDFLELEKFYEKNKYSNDELIRNDIEQKINNYKEDTF